MRYFEKCDTCKHDHGNAWTGVCKNCCFCDKYEEKPKEDDFESRLNRMKNTLGAWACIYGISLAVEVDIRNEQGKLMGPWKRNFVFVDKKTGNKMDFAVDFNLHESEEDVQIIDKIKDTIRRKMVTKAKGYAFNDPETYGRGGFVYLTTRNPYHKTYGDYIANLVDDIAKRPLTTCFKIDTDDLDDRYQSIVNKRIADKATDEQFNTFMRRMLGINKEVNMNRVSLRIKDVIFNGPATIVIWADGTKTVVKAQDGEKIDYEKGLAMAIAKKALGNQGNYYDHFEKWLKNAPVVKKITTKRPSKKVEITDEEIQAQSDALFADFDKKVKDKAEPVYLTREQIFEGFKSRNKILADKVTKIAKVPYKNQIVVTVIGGDQFKYDHDTNTTWRMV